jgi:hypothetical protein
VTASSKIAASEGVEGGRVDPDSQLRVWLHAGGAQVVDREFGDQRLVEHDLVFPPHRRFLRQAQQGGVPIGQRPTGGRWLQGVPVPGGKAQAGVRVDQLGHRHDRVETEPFEELPVVGLPVRRPERFGGQPHQDRGGGLGLPGDRLGQDEVAVQQQVQCEWPLGTGDGCHSCCGRGSQVVIQRGNPALVVSGQVGVNRAQCVHEIMGVGQGVRPNPAERGDDVPKRVRARHRWAQIGAQGTMGHKGGQHPVDRRSWLVREVDRQFGRQVPQHDGIPRDGHGTGDDVEVPDRQVHRFTFVTAGLAVADDERAVAGERDVVPDHQQPLPHNGVGLQARDHRGQPGGVHPCGHPVPVADTDHRVGAEGERRDPGEQPERCRPALGAQQVAGDGEHRATDLAIGPGMAVADLRDAPGQVRAGRLDGRGELLRCPDLAQPRPPPRDTLDRGVGQVRPGHHGGLVCGCA